MRKRVTGRLTPEPSRKSAEEWLDLEEIATVEVTSEDATFPVERALTSNDMRGWRAGEGGEQQIRLLFDKPVSLHKIHISFHETEVERTQEFVIRWTPAHSGAPIEIVRQQWNFSPRGSTVETEDYSVDLKDVSSIEIGIRPDLWRPEAVASLASLRLA